MYTRAEEEEFEERFEGGMGIRLNILKDGIVPKRESEREKEMLQYANALGYAVSRLPNQYDLFDLRKGDPFVQVFQGGKSELSGNVYDLKEYCESRPQSFRPDVEI